MSRPRRMIYVEETNFSRQIDVLEYLRRTQKLDVIFWLCPEEKTTICGQPLANNKLIEGEPVTTYSGVEPHKTQRTELTTELVEEIRKSEKILNKSCDSIVLYEQNKKTWFACTIGHEGMCLINNKAFLEGLISSGFNASLNKPEWW